MQSNLFVFNIKLNSGNPVKRQLIKAVFFYLDFSNSAVKIIDIAGNFNVREIIYESYER